jgi:hypothetical protein
MPVLFGEQTAKWVKNGKVRRPDFGFRHWRREPQFVGRCSTRGWEERRFRGEIVAGTRAAQGAMKRPYRAARRNKIRRDFTKGCTRACGEPSTQKNVSSTLADTFLS